MTTATTGNGKTTETTPPVDRLEIAEPDLRKITVWIKGSTPLVTSNGKQALDALNEDRSGKARTKKITNPEEAFQSSRYIMEDGRDGFPTGAIQRALKDAAIRFTDKKGTVVVGAIRVLGDKLLPIEGPEPRRGEDFVRHGGRTPDIAYRAYYDSWQIKVPVIYNAEVISEANVVTLFSLAGFSVGIGAWRPEKNGTMGQFEVEKIEKFEN